uniref:Uncharacterized protein n=1 Tax=Cannabis sativa TaxID=3483 RepID=A0A803P927_CANSA
MAVNGKACLSALLNSLIESLDPKTELMMSLFNGKGPVAKSLTKLVTNLQTLKSSLDEAEREQIKDGKEKWLQELKEALFDADDLVYKMRILDSEENQKGKSKILMLITQRSVAHVEESDCVWNGHKNGIIEELLKSFDEDGKKVSVISIVGKSGFGKTTLAYLVSNDEKVNKEFQIKAWIGIGDYNIDAVTVMKLIIERLTSDNKVIVTTKNKSVAEVMKSVSTHNLDIITPEDSLSLFEKHATPSNQFTEIGKKIVSKCAIPLAIKSVAGLLRDEKDDKIWTEVEKELSEESLYGIHRGLWLSYYYMSSPLKQCFAYLAMFPKGTSPRSCLRVLSLSEHCITKLPDSIGELKYLKYLDLSFTEIEELPDTVCKLYNLQTLLLEGCARLATLPKEIGKLSNLRHLHTPPYLREMPLQLGKITTLQTLSEFVVGKDPQPGVELLRKLELLRGTLEISRLENVDEADHVKEGELEEKKSLHKLILNWGYSHAANDKENQVLEALKPHSKLKQLSIFHYKGNSFPSWIEDKSFELEDLDLYGFENCSSLPPLGQLPSLQLLTISDFPKVENIDSVKGTEPSFGTLKRLRLQSMPKLNEWSIKESNSFHCLEELELEDCPELKVSLSTNLPALKKLVICECDQLQLLSKEIQSLETIKIDECKSQKSFLEGGLPSSLKEIVISGCENLTTLDEEAFKGLTSLNKLYISFCINLECLPTKLPASLSILRINNCPKLVPRLQKESGKDIDVGRLIQMWLAQGFINDVQQGDHCRYFSKPPPPQSADGRSSSSKIFHARFDFDLSSTKELEMFGANKMRTIISSDIARYICANLTNLDKLDQISNLEVLVLDDLPNLEDISSSSSLPKLLSSLEELWLTELPKLKTVEKRNEGLIMDRISLEMLEKTITHIASSSGSAPLSNLKNMRIAGIKDFDAVKIEWGAFKNLRSLTFDGLPKLKNLPSDLQNVGSLEELYVWRCTIKEIPGWISKLGKLEKLVIRVCPYFKQLSAELDSLKIRTLEMKDCNMLFKRCEEDIGADWEKIKYISRRDLGPIFSK